MAGKNFFYIKSQSTEKILWGVIIIAGLILLWNLGIINIPGSKTKEQETIIEQNSHKIDSLRTAIINLENNQNKHNLVISNLRDSMLLINNQLNKNELKIQKLRKDYNEKINSISNYSSTQLEEFFTNRYK